MLFVDVPTLPELRSLNALRADAAASLYLPTTPLTQHTDTSRIELGNMAKEAEQALTALGVDTRRVSALLAQVDALVEDDGFWREQARGLAILLTPDEVRTYRLANALTRTVEVSDRFHLKPLLRAVTFPHAAYVLALSEGDVRLVEVFAELPASKVAVPGLPKDAASAVGKSTLNDRSHSRRLHGSEGQNVRFAQFARKVDAALRPILSGRDTPLILVGTGRLPAVYRSVNSYPHLLAEGADVAPDRLSEEELAALARPLLDATHAAELASVRSRFEALVSEGRASSDVEALARAATRGAIDTLLVDMDASLPGLVDEVTGAVQLADRASAATYDVLDEVVGRALITGARVLSVRAADLPDGAQIAGILRYAA